MGVGTLPGNQSEPHVARLPEESIHPQYDSGNVDTAAQVSMKPSEELHGNEAATGDVRRHSSSDILTQAPGVIPDGLPPRRGSETAGKPVSSQDAEGEKSLGATQADTTRPTEEQKPPHVQQETQAHKRATFMEKMKGEAKVLLGKIEGKQEKVAEGERMKHPEAKAAPSEGQKETQGTASAKVQEQTQTAPVEVEQQKQAQA